MIPEKHLREALLLTSFESLGVTVTVPLLKGVEQPKKSQNAEMLTPTRY